MSRYDQLVSGQWFGYDAPLDIACCHCGLVHRVSVDWKNKRLRFIEKPRATAALRRHHDHPAKIRRKAPT